MKSALLLLAIAAGGATGCATNDLSLSILQMEAVTESTSCAAVAMIGPERTRGLLDVSLVTTQGYIGWPLVRNNEQSRMPANGDPEFSSIQLSGVNITLQLTGSALAAVPDSDRKFFYASAGGRLDPAAMAAMFVEVLPAKIVNELASHLPAVGFLTVTAEIQPVGMQSNDQIIGGPIEYPIDLCDGCLHQATQNCPLPALTTVQPVGCVPWQDDVPSCCLDTSTNETLCGTAAPVAAAM